LLKSFFCQMPMSMVIPIISQNVLAKALRVGGIRTENSVRTSCQAMEVHARRAFQDARINTSQMLRVTEKGRFID